MSDWVTDEWTGIMNVRRKNKDDDSNHKLYFLPVDLTGW